MQEKRTDKSQSTKTQKWYLRILDKTIFGPVDLETLCNWANQARIIPGHHVSSDKTKWVPVETIKGFHMNWQVTMRNGDIYGPINISLLKNLVKDDIIDSTASLTNTLTGKTDTVINQMIDLAGNISNLQFSLKEADDKYKTIKIRYEELQHKLQKEKDAHKLDNTKNTKTLDDLRSELDDLRSEIKQKESEKHAMEVMEVYPEAILVNNDSQNALSKSICTEETLQQLEIQATNDLLSWHKQYKKNKKQKKSNFLSLELFR